jgi:CRP/FNR family cyclic AMP-dependent transcriptional regulator
MFSFLKRRPEHPRMAQFRQIGLFSTLQPKELRVIDGLLYERRYLEGEIVFDEGEEGQALYVVLSGKALICKRSDAGLMPIAEIPTGSLFGELALLWGLPRSAQVRAGEDCVLAALSRADFETLIETHAAIATKIAMQLARDLGQKLTTRYLTLETQPL